MLAHSFCGWPHYCRKAAHALPSLPDEPNGGGGGQGEAGTQRPAQPSPDAVSLGVVEASSIIEPPPFEAPRSPVAADASPTPGVLGAVQLWAQQLKQLWEAVRQEAEQEEQEEERARADEAAGAERRRQAKSDGQDLSAGAPPSVTALTRQPWVTRIVLFVSCLAFFLQWRTLLGPLASGIMHGQLDLVPALLLVSPMNTQFSEAWQLVSTCRMHACCPSARSSGLSFTHSATSLLQNVLSVRSGDLGSSFASSFLNSGVVGLLVSEHLTPPYAPCTSKPLCC